MRRATRAAVLLAAVIATAAPRARADGPAPSPAPKPAPAATVDEIVIREALWIPPVGVSRREATHTDAIEAQIVAGTWEFPKAGEKVTLPDGSTKEWTEAKADDKGWFEGPNLEGGGYLFARVASESERVMLLHGVGHDLVYANGEIRPGDPYQYGWLRLPLLLKKGGNFFLFRVSRGRMTARLVQAPAPLFLSPDDATLPDVLVLGDPPLPVPSGGPGWRGAVVAVNASTASVTEVRPREVGGRAWWAQAAPSLPPLTIRKLPFDAWIEPRGGSETVEVNLELARDGDSPALTVPVPVRLRVRPSDHVYRRTYASRVDESLQYYAVNPAWPTAKDAEPPALILSLHGASVEALGQAEAYAPKPWATIVAPTNRRPYGFDWEDWGRADAHDVLISALFFLRLDRSRVYLTGHSMGGHGTWQVAAHYPEFAAIGPSAGWISFASYAGAPTDEPKSPVEKMLRRAASPSDTLALASNYASMGVYILHGDADDNVPISEARKMADALKGFHHDFLVHEQKGAGHWWDASDEPGTDCVDWAPMMDFFSRHRIPSDEETREVDFATCDPGVSYRSHWVQIDAQVHARQTSRIHIRCDPGKRRFTATTENVARFAIEPGPLGSDPPAVSLEIDGAKIPATPWFVDRGRSRLWLEKRAEGWVPVPKPSLDVKGPHRCGPFKAAFDDRFKLVYGTKGTPTENAWAYSKARYDSEAWYYRANGSVDLVADEEFLKPPPKREGLLGLSLSEPIDPTDLEKGVKPGPESEEARERRERTSVILYGNADTNAAWEPLLGKSPVQVKRGSVTIGGREIKGDDLACLFVRPRPGSDVASVGVVAGTSPLGMRLTERLPYFTSGVHYPDVTVIGTEMLSKGVEGVRVAGFFGNDWGVETGEFAWRDEK